MLPTMKSTAPMSRHGLNGINNNARAKTASSKLQYFIKQGGTYISALFDIFYISFSQIKIFFNIS